MPPSGAACDHRLVTLVLTLLIMAVVAVVAAVAAGRIAGGLDAPASSLPGRGLPEGPVDVAALDRVRFSPALRGYRMDEVDDVLDRLTAELRRRDEEIAWLRSRADEQAEQAEHAERGRAGRSGEQAEQAERAEQTRQAERVEPAERMEPAEPTEHGVEA